MRDLRLEKLSGVLVNYAVGVKKDHLVRLSGPPLAVPLLLELCRAVIAAGGHPMFRMSPEEAGEILVKHGSDEQLRFVNPVSMYEYEKIDCSIGIWAEENTRALTNCDPKRISLMQSARRPLTELFLKRAAEGKLKWVGTQFPTQSAAQAGDSGYLAASAYAVSRYFARRSA